MPSAAGDDDCSLTRPRGARNVGRRRKTSSIPAPAEMIWTQRCVRCGEFDREQKAAPMTDTHRPDVVTVAALNVGPGWCRAVTVRGTADGCGARSSDGHERQRRNRPVRRLRSSAWGRKACCLERLVAEFGAHPLPHGLRVIVFNRSLPSVLHLSTSRQPDYLLVDIGHGEVDLWDGDGPQIAAERGPDFSPGQEGVRPSVPLSGDDSCPGQSSDVIVQGSTASSSTSHRRWR